MATDFYVGAVLIANRGTTPCTLRGTPEVLLLASDGSPLDVMRASITGSGTPALVVVRVGKAISRFGAPPCDDASGPSTLVVYPFQEPVR